MGQRTLCFETQTERNRVSNVMTVRWLDQRPEDSASLKCDSAAAKFFPGVSQSEAVGHSPVRIHNLCFVCPNTHGLTSEWDDDADSNRKPEEWTGGGEEDADDDDGRSDKESMSPAWARR